MPRIVSFFRVAWETSSDRVRRTSRPTGVGAILVVLFLLWWWWPGIASPGQKTVTIVGSDQVESARQEVSRRLREEGFAVFWLDSITTWCDVTKHADVSASNTFVFVPDDLQDCDTPASDVVEGLNAAGLTKNMVLIDFDLPGQDFPGPDFTQKLIDYGARRVASERLIGAVDQPMPCQWWEDCDASGTVVTRNGQGLTSSGFDRLARLITAAVV